MSSIWAVFAALTFLGCSPHSSLNAAPHSLIDRQATPQTIALFEHMSQLAEQQIMFGHQDDLAYGLHWWNEPNRSDVKDVVGDYPAVTGWEIGGLELGHQVNIDGVNFANMQAWIKQVFLRGGINTISWHIHDPVSGASSWSNQSPVEQLLPGASHHHQLLAYLDSFVAFNQQLFVVNEFGQQVHIPIIFRPWHEHSGDWFWWGKGNTAEQDYIALWRFTVHYLRDVKQQHNLIYAYSPDRSRLRDSHFTEDYLWGYPGDDYVDIMGIDNYWDMRGEMDQQLAQQKLASFVFSTEQLSKLAHQHGKLAALTEAGSGRLEYPPMWTEILLTGLQANTWTKRMAYVLVWRNSNLDKEQREQFFTPPPEHPSAPYFKRFYQDPMTLFNADLPPMYRAP
ncbi:glycosyl transferase family 1 [Neiella sp. HB171785]|uniref:Glycosyl transferase family 1 n=1 Tax=Neiella litorisoli TaxID=2771431 RepID=A0A8J6UFT8_9GAMM|nr:glycosyl hydrolase [Neiella litorisoli]MBD1389146.1 glycosyl transferase family 1 [Neiella litorisoli]